LQIIVCLSFIVNPESLIEIKEEKIKTEASLILNPYDEYALEYALKLKDKQQAKVIVLHLGSEEVKENLKKIKSYGVDEIYRINIKDKNLVEDNLSIAFCLAKAIKNFSFDFIFCGETNLDFQGNFIPTSLAEFLNIPILRKVINIKENLVTVKANNCQQIYELHSPLLLSCLAGEILRYPKIKDIFLSKKEEIKVLNLSEIKVTPAELQNLQNLKLVKYVSPKPKKNFSYLLNLSPLEKLDKILEPTLKIKGDKQIFKNKEEGITKLTNFLSWELNK